MTFSSKKIDDLRLELTVDLNGDDLKKYINEVEKQLADNLILEGFRPGKAPHDLVRKHFGAEKISQEALSLAVQSSLADVLENEKFEILSYPTGADFKIQENNSAKLIYHVVLTVFPEIKLGKYIGLDIKKKLVSVSESEIQDFLHNLQELRTQRQDTHHPAQLGDRVEVDFLITLEDKEIEAGKSENHPLILGKDSFISGFEEQIIGMKENEKKRFSLKVPADYYQKNISGKEIDIDLTLKKVENLSVPKLDSDFAKSVGHFNSLEDLEKNIKQGLVLEKEAKEKERIRLDILNKIVAESHFIAPPVLVEKHLDALIQEFDNELHQKGMELGLYLAHIKKTQEDLRKDWGEKAESRVKMSLVARAIAKNENINISDNEIAGELAVLADNYTKKGMIEELKNIDPEAIKLKIQDLLLNEKVFEFLEKNNIIA